MAREKQAIPLRALCHFDIIVVVQDVPPFQVINYVPVSYHEKVGLARDISIKFFLTCRV